MNDQYMDKKLMKVRFSRRLAISVFAVVLVLALGAGVIYAGSQPET